jgi:signal transduction histidine kinase
MRQIINGLTRSTLIIVGVWMLIATGLSVVAVALSFHSDQIDASRVHGAMEGLMKTALDANAKHKSTQDTANALATLGRGSGISVAVFDDSGRRLAGDNAGVNPPLAGLGYNVFRTQGEMLRPSKGQVHLEGPPMVGFAGTVFPGFGPLPFGDFGMNMSAIWVRIPHGLALIRLTESSATLIERGYLIGMIAILVLGIVVVAPVQRRIFTRQLAPLSSVESALRRLGEGDYSKIEVVGHPQGTMTIVEAYNASADRLSAAIKRQAETESNMRQFVAEAGHALRTPLTVLMGFVEVLQEGAIKEHALAQRILESVAIEGERMRALILKLLLLARLDATRPEHSELVDVSAIAHEVVTGFQALPGGNKIGLSAEPRTYVNATTSEIRELLANLLDNALKHAPGSTTNAMVRRTNGTVELSVTDDGPGMMADLKQRAFDRFTRGDDRGSVPGSGLGLAIVKRIVDRTRGTIELDTMPGKGTKVLVRIPIAQVESHEG